MAAQPASLPSPTEFSDIAAANDDEALAAEEIRERLGDWRWRMNNLYKVVNKDGKVVTFKMNWAQEYLFKQMWFRNVILKCRQLGMTTFVMIFMLDQCLFNSNVKCGVIAHGLDEAADLFDNKIKFAYENLPDWLREIKKTKRFTGKMLKFENGSSIRVGTSMRSGTLNYLHISEFGKICRKYPDRAKEIVTGSFPAVERGVTFIESTAEGQDGYFFDYCEKAQKKQLSLTKLTRKDFKFFFYPWWREPAYRLDDEDTKLVAIPSRLEEYFWELEEKHGIELDAAQKAWYVKEEEVLGDDIYREHPSTPEEAFKQIIEGAIFRKQFIKIYSTGRIGDYPYIEGIPVDTWWDLGLNDAMAIWFTQTIGGKIRVIDYYENNNEHIAHYAEVLNEKPYSYGVHNGPHDLSVRDGWSPDGEVTTRAQKAKGFGIRFNTVPRCSDKQDAVEAGRDALVVCEFHESACSEGIAKLERYRREWDAKLGRWKDKPRHDDASNTADAFMTLATGHPMFGHRSNLKAKKVNTQRSGRTA
ncbi:MAG: terminase [Gammaproteobacteria bacterium]|nr:terminase [Gammaproteobacteria bacterium]